MSYNSIRGNKFWRLIMSNEIFALAILFLVYIAHVVTATLSVALTAAAITGFVIKIFKDKGTNVFVYIKEIKPSDSWTIWISVFIGSLALYAVLMGLGLSYINNALLEGRVNVLSVVIGLLVLKVFMYVIKLRNTTED